MRKTKKEYYANLEEKSFVGEKFPENCETYTPGYAKTISNG